MRKLSKEQIGIIRNVISKWEDLPNPKEMWLRAWRLMKYYDEAMLEFYKTFRVGITSFLN